MRIPIHNDDARMSLRTQNTTQARFEFGSDFQSCETRSAYHNCVSCGACRMISKPVQMLIQYYSFFKMVGGKAVFLKPGDWWLKTATTSSKHESVIGL